MGLDSRQSTPGFKRQVVFINGETRSFKRASLLMERSHGLKVSANTIERICLEVGQDLATVAEDGWRDVLDGETVVPKLAIVSCDGGRIRTRKTGCGPGVHLAGKGWNETKNAIFVSASSETSPSDPEPEPPECFLDKEHVAKLTETAKSRENARSDEPFDEPPASEKSTRRRRRAKHKPQRIHRTLISSIRSSREFGLQMSREAKRRRFGESARKAFVGDGQRCNWQIHEEHFSDYVPILDFVHAVSYLHRASLICEGDRDAAWLLYERLMKQTWLGKVSDVIAELEVYQSCLGNPPAAASDDDPREQLRQVICYLRNNCGRMHYSSYRCAGLPTTSAWMESAVKEINFRTKGTEMFWNNPDGAESILQLRAASLSDDDRLARFLVHRPGSDRVRKGRISDTTAA